MRQIELILLGLLCCTFAANAKRPSKIKGGDLAAEGEYPYFVTIRWSGDTQASKCGGTILNKRYILTAAHCIEGKEAPELTIIAGSTSYGQGPHYKVSKVISYGNHSYQFENDIGLLKTTEDIVFDDNVKPVKLPTEDLRGHGQKVEGVGYGRLGATSDFPYQLRKIRLVIEDQRECQKLKNVPDDRRLCTRNPFGAGLCYGDSGGPLLIDDVIVGVFIRMFPCGNGKPDMFTRVYAYLDWIKSNIQL